MGPFVRVPYHINALYVFAIVNWLALFHITLVDANILVVNEHNVEVDDFEDMPAKFGPRIPLSGLVARYVFANPVNACQPIQRPPGKPGNKTNWIVIIRRRDCDFRKKVEMAQNAGYKAAIVHNVGSDKLMPMAGGSGKSKINISSAFIGETSALVLKNLSERQKKYGITYYLLLDRGQPFDFTIYIKLFGIVVGICFLLMLSFFAAKFIMDFRKKRRSRLSKNALKKLPVKKFKKGDEYEVCAICLDDYEEGDKMRILPCAHAYHMQCVDPWLCKNKRVCPICKRKVIPGDKTDSSEDEQDEEDSEGTERTPLLAEGGGRTERSRVPESLQGHVAPSYLPDSSDSSPSSSYDHSAQVHRSAHAPSRGRGPHPRGYGATAGAGRASINTQDGDLRELSSDEEEDRRALRRARTGSDRVPREQELPVVVDYFDFPSPVEEVRSVEVSDPAIQERAQDAAAPAPVAAEANDTRGAIGGAEEPRVTTQKRKPKKVTKKRRNDGEVV